MNYLSVFSATLFVLFIMATSSLAQQPSVADSCLWLIVGDTSGHVDPTEYHFNGPANCDSVHLDTCGTRDSWEFQHWYCRGGYKIYFQQSPLDPLQVRTDSAMVFTWRAIDSAHTGLRTGLQQLEKLFGNYTLRNGGKFDGNCGGAVTTEGSSLFLRFPEPVNVSAVQEQLSQLPGIQGFIIPTVVALASVPTTPTQQSPLAWQGSNIIVQLSPEQMQHPFVSLIDLQGRIIGSAIAEPTTYGGNAILATQHLPQGIYFVLVQGKAHTVRVQ